MLLRSRPSSPSTSPVRRLLDGVLTLERLALGRAGAGTVMLTRPRLLPGLLGVDSATASRTSWVVQMVGARELALGLGTWVAVRRGDVPAARLWVAAGLLSDAVDAAVVASAVGRGRLSAGPGAAVVTVAGTAAALQSAALTEWPEAGSPA